jgi:hypothetical protein
MIMMSALSIAHRMGGATPRIFHTAAFAPAPPPSSSWGCHTPVFLSEIEYEAVVD